MPYEELGTLLLPRIRIQAFPNGVWWLHGTHLVAPAGDYPIDLIDRVERPQPPDAITTEEWRALAHGPRDKHRDQTNDTPGDWILHLSDGKTWCNWQCGAELADIFCEIFGGDWPDEAELRQRLAAWAVTRIKANCAIALAG